MGGRYLRYSIQNGSGKTVLLKCICGNLNQALCLFRRKDIHSPTLKGGKISRVHTTNTPLKFPYTVLEFVVMGKASQFGVFEQSSKSELTVHKPTASACDDCESSNSESKVLLLDEPTAHPDFGNQIKFLTTIRKIATSKNSS